MKHTLLQLLVSGLLFSLCRVQAGEVISAPSLSASPADAAFANMFADRGFFKGSTNYLAADSTGATFEPGEPAPYSGTGRRTLWVTWIAFASGRCTIDTMGSAFDTVLSVYTNGPAAAESLTNLVLLGGDDDGGGNLASAFTFAAQAGTHYHIRVAGFGVLDSGAIEFHLSLVNPTDPPAAPTVLGLSTVSGSQLALQWEASPGSVDGYWIERSTNAIDFTQIAVVGAAATLYLDTRLTTNTTYFYRLRAYDAYDTSDYSNTRSGRTTAPAATPFAVRINFAAARAPVPPAWETDDGLAYGDRLNGYCYGWDQDNGSHGRWLEPGASPYDSFQYLQAPGGSVWEIAVPANGYYVIHLVAGSAVEFEGFYRLAVEGVPAIDRQPSAANPFLEATNLVRVDDGRLTITGLPGAVSNRLAFVAISAAIPPSILAQPSSRTVELGSFATLTVRAEGTPPLSYQWRKDGVEIPGATNASLTLTQIQYADAGVYAVVVSSPCGSILSADAVLSVVVLEPDFFDDFEPGIHAEQWSALSGTVAATNFGGSVSGANALWFGGDGERFATTRPLNAASGGLIDFQLRLAGGPAAPWRMPTLPGEGVVLEYSADAGISWAAIRAYDTCAFTNWSRIREEIPLAAQTPATLFRWRQLSNSGAAFSHWALDDVTVLVSTNAPPAVRSQPCGQSALVQTRAAFSVAATGARPLSYQWQFNGADLPGQTNPTLTLSNLTIYQAGVYSVAVSNAFGVASSGKATLTIDPGTTPLTVNLLDLNTSWKYNQTADLTGTGWYGTNYNDAAWPSGSGLLAFEVNTAITPLVHTVLADPRTPAPGLQAARLYYFRTTCVWNMNLAVSNLTLTTMLDDGAVIYLNGNPVLGVRMATNPLPGYYALTTDQAPNNGDAMQEVFTIPAGLWRPGANVIAAEVHQSQANSSDIVWGMALAAQVLVPNTLPIITDQPTNQSVLPGRQVTFAVGVSGTPSPAFQWRLNGTNLLGRTSRTLVLNNVQLSNAGDYSVVVSNLVGAVTSQVATLTVQVPPSILTQPQSQTVFAGTSVTLRVAAAGAEPLSYYWSWNGAALPDQTNSLLILPQTLPSLSGDYTVTVTNPFGAVTSSPAALTVVGPLISGPALRYANGRFTLRFDGYPEGSYSLEYSTNLADWVSLDTIVNPGAPVDYVDTSATNAVRFYRLRWNP